MLCFGVNPIKVSRNKKSKWYVTWEEFPQVKYDRYCTGFFLLISSELVPAMYAESFYVRFFWIDDYWMSAMLGKAVNAKLQFENNRVIIIPRKNRTAEYIKKIETLYAIHTDHQLNFLTEMWNHVLLNHKLIKKEITNVFERHINYFN